MELISPLISLLLLLPLLLLLVICCSVNHAEQINFCGYYLGAIHDASINLDEAYVFNTTELVRSKGECATLCYDNIYCKTALYQPDGDCLFISNFTDTLTLTHATDYSPSADVVLQMQTRYQVEARNQKNMEVMTCPSACTGYSVCLLDCSGDPTTAEPMCMDITTQQYDVDGCHYEPYVSSHEYLLNNLDKTLTIGNHEVFRVYHTKKFASTSLRLKFRGTLKSNHYYTRYQLRVNGNNCGDWVESINYNAETDTHHYKASGIHGLCHNISIGENNVTMYVHVAVYGDSTTSARIGAYTENSRLYIEELGQGPWVDVPIKPCPSLPLYNIRQHASTAEWEDDSGDLWSVPFRKMEASTSLRINLDFVTRLHTAGSDNHICVTWYILIDDAHCKPTALGKTVANVDYANSVNNEHRSVEIEGHCNDIPAKDLTIKLQITNCAWGVTLGDGWTGWNSCRQRFIIEEYHPSSNVAAAMAKDGLSLYRSPQFNMVNHGYGHPSKGEDTGLVYTFPNYTKYYQSSGLQITMSSDARCWNGHGNADYEGCCMHYFVINDKPCETPGTISGISALNKNTNLHRPIMIEGICEEIPAGTVTIQLFAGICKGFSKKGECHWGWNSYVHIMFSESFVERTIVDF